MEHLSQPIQPVLTIDHPVLTVREDQEKWLAEGIQALQDKAAKLKRCIEENGSNGAAGFTRVIHAAADMLGELRTDLLTPQNYYELYIRVFDEIPVFLAYLEQAHREHGLPLEDIYEGVQHIGYIVPRLYLLIVAAAAYINAGEQQPALALLQDLVEMCKGVQHPTRGLFLRHFLLTLMKGRLPGDWSRSRHSAEERPQGDGGGTAIDTADLIVQNFKEMVWLWVRMEAKNYRRVVTERRVPEKQLAKHAHLDRLGLRVLVGMNLVHISQLDGIDWRVYQEKILPKLIAVIVRYQEPVAQQYLFEVIVQVFPDEFHLFTLDTLLNGMQSLIASVDTCEVLCSLMDRLGNYVQALREGLTEASSNDEESVIHNLFAIFFDKLGQKDISFAAKPPVAREIKRSDTAPPASPMLLETYIHVMGGLVRLSTKVDPRVEQCDAHTSMVMQCVAAKLAAGVTAGKSIAPQALRAAEQLVITTIERVSHLARLLEMEGMASLVATLPFESRRSVALVLGEVVLKRLAGGNTLLWTLDHVAKLFELLDPLLCDEDERAEVVGADVEARFIEDQHIVCCVLHLLHHDDYAVYLKMLSGVRKLLVQGGPRRLTHTLPVLVSLYMQAALRIHRKLQECEPTQPTGADADADGDAAAPKNIPGAPTLRLLAKTLRYLYTGDGKGMLEALSAEAPILSFYNYVTAAGVTDTCEQVELSYELYTEAFTLYEEYAADRRDQLDMLLNLINSLCMLHHMPEEQYEVMATKVCQYASKLVKRQDQSHMVALCAALFHKKSLSAENQQRVTECLQRALKTARQVATTHQLGLYVELLNIFLHHFAAKHSPINASYVNNLLDLFRDLSVPPHKETGEEEEDDTLAATVTNEVQPSEQGGEGDDAKRTPRDTLVATNTKYEKARLMYRNTAQYIRSRQSVDERWKEIEI